jgi:cell shape-determining protein MreC
VPKRPAESLVQELLAQARQLKVENERLKLELREIRAGAGRPDPRLRQLEAENQRLRDELQTARTVRDELQDAVDEAVAKMKEASR